MFHVEHGQCVLFALTSEVFHVEQRRTRNRILRIEFRVRLAMVLLADECHRIAGTLLVFLPILVLRVASDGLHHRSRGLAQRHSSCGTHR